MSSEQQPILDDNHRKELIRLLTRSGQADPRQSHRQSLCQNINVDSSELDFIEGTPATVFSERLVTKLIDSDNNEALLQLCLEIGNKVEGRLIEDLKNILNNIDSRLKNSEDFNDNLKQKLLKKLKNIQDYLEKKEDNTQNLNKLVKPNNFLWNTLISRSVTSISSSLIITIIVIVVHFNGVLLPLEFMFYDIFMKFKFSEDQDKRILVIEITNENLNKWNDEAKIKHKNLNELNEEKISDERLKKLLETLEKGKPKIIGIDILRDVPQPAAAKKAHTDLISYLEKKSQDSNIFSICVYGDKETTIREGKVPPSGSLVKKDRKLNRVGFNNALQDVMGGTAIRRQLLSLDNENDKTVGCSTEHSFSYLLAARYLEIQTENKITIKDSTKTDFLTINNGESTTVVYPLLKGNIGGYQGGKLWDINPDEGEQILINYRSGRTPFKIKDAQEIVGLTQEKLLELVKDRIVLIGYTAWGRDDLYYTPVHPRLAGVIIHAHMVSQIVNAVMENRPLLLPLPLIVEVFLIFVCSIVGGKWRHPPQIVIGILVINGVCYFSFMNGIWLPVVPSGLALALTPCAATIIHRLTEPKSNPATGVGI